MTDKLNKILQKLSQPTQPEVPVFPGKIEGKPGFTRDPLNGKLRALSSKKSMNQKPVFKSKPDR